MLMCPSGGFSTTCSGCTLDSITLNFSCTCDGDIGESVVSTINLSEY
jgi:hypothetical protein